MSFRDPIARERGVSGLSGGRLQQLKESLVSTQTRGRGRLETERAMKQAYRRPLSANEGDEHPFSAAIQNTHVDGSPIPALTNGDADKQVLPQVALAARIGVSGGGGAHAAPGGRGRCRGPLMSRDESLLPR